MNSHPITSPLHPMSPLNPVSPLWVGRNHHHTATTAPATQPASDKEFGEAAGVFLVIFLVGLLFLWAIHRA
jgi:hypothetical protein